MERSEFTVPCIYLLTNRYDGKMYVGQTSNLTKRLAKHRYAMNHRSFGYRKSNKDYRLYTENSGKLFDDVFIPSVLDVEKDPDKRNDKEKFWIDKLNTTDPAVGYNGKHGGDYKPHVRVAGDSVKYIRQSKEIYVYDSLKDAYMEFESAASFGATIGMLGENVGDRARNMHLARNGRYYIFFKDSAYRNKITRKYIDKIKTKLVNDINDPKFKLRATINSRINYMTRILEVLQNVENHFDNHGEIDYQKEIAFFESYRICDKRENDRKAHRLKTQTAKANNIPIVDDSAHRGTSIVLVNPETCEYMPFVDIPTASDKLDVPNSTLKGYAKEGIKLRGKWYVYYINDDRRDATLDHVWESYRSKGKSVRDYVKGYFVARRVTDLYR